MIRGLSLGTIFGVLVSGVLYALAQPDRGIWPAGFVCLVPLFVALSGRSLRARIWICIAMANVAALVGTAGAASEGIAAYFELSPALAVLGWLGLAQLLGSLPMLVFALLAGDPAQGGGGGALRLAGAWVAAELLRSVFLSGMPWFLLAYGVANLPILAQAASLGGVLLVSGMLVVVNAALARLALEGLGAASPGLLGSLAAVALLALAGALVPGAEPVEAVSVALVQGPSGGAERRGPAEAADEIARLARSSAKAAQAELVIWPENAANVPLPWNASLLRDLLLEAAIPAAHLIVGAPVWPEPEGFTLHTSALLLSPAREVLGRHDKVKLVPFGEFTPWPLRPAETSAETRPGKRPQVLDAATLRVGPLICYEVLFGSLSRSLVRDGANVLANLSNDGWFRHAAALEQHLAAGIYRAIETRRPMLRATRTGITASIDERGQILGRLPLHEEGVLETRVSPGRGRTPYVAGGYLFPWVASLAVLALALRRVFPSRPGDPPVY